jgi:hypothetical protein
MRVWLSGPRQFRGLIRPGISFSLDELSPRRPANRRRLEGSFIYVIRADNGLIKIGISTNPSARLAQLRTASAAHLAIAYVGALRCNGYAVEAETHRTLAQYRLEGDWFRCPADTAVAAIGAAAHRLGEPIASGDPKLADAVVLIASAQEDARSRNILGFVVLAIIKGVLAIICAAVATFSFWVIYLIITTPRPPFGPPPF